MLLLGCGARALVPPPRLGSHPEAVCALSFVPRLLGHSEHPRLFVVGSAPWLGAVLGRLPAPAAVTLLPFDDSVWRDAALRMTMEDALVLVVAETLSVLVQSMPVGAMPYLARTVMWAGSPPGSANATAEAVRGLAYKCLFNAALLLTAPDGGTTVYRNPCTCGEHPPPVSEENHWSPELGWAFPMEPFARPCRQWRRPADGVFEARINPFLFRGSIRRWAEDRQRELRHFAKHHGVALRTYWMSEEDGELEHAVACRLDVLASPLPLSAALHLVPFPWAVTHMIAAVPAPRRRRREPLSVLADEFSVTRWLTTYAAVFAVAAAVFLLRADGPLAADALEGRGAPLPGALGVLRRPVLGCWLLAGVVLTTTYQGQLLSELNVRNSVENIDSVEQLAASNLTIMMHNPFHASLFPLQAWGLAHRVHYTVGTGTTLTDIFDLIGEARTAAVLLRPGETELPPMVADTTRVHTFQLPLEQYVTNYVVMPGSPFEASLRKFLGRWRAAGLADRFANRDTTVTGRQKPPTHRTSARAEPLRLKHARPMFTILLDGLVSAGLVLLTEILLSMRNRSGPGSKTRCPTPQKAI